MVEATESERGARWSVYRAASVELWRYFRQGDDERLRAVQARARLADWLAVIRISFPVTIFHFPRQILSRLFFTSLFFVYSERRRPAWKENARAAHSPLEWDSQ